MSGIVIKGMMHRFQWQKSYVWKEKKEEDEKIGNDYNKQCRELHDFN